MFFDIASWGIAVTSRPGVVRRTLFRAAVCFALLQPLATALLTADANATIVERITTTTLTLPQALEGETSDFCTWGFCTGFGPRLYQAPLDDGRTLIGWTDVSGNGHVSRVNGAAIEATFDFPNTPVRGLVAHADNSFAVLLLDFATPGTKWDNNMKLSKRTSAGAEVWTTQLLNSESAIPNPTSFGATGIGDSRLAYGGGQYGAYFSVHSVPDIGGVEHEGDQLTFVNDAGVIQTGGWAWGLSHSMAALIDYHPDLARLTAFGSSDCFPGKGLFADHTHTILTAEGNCSGGVAVQLGQMAAASGGRWVVAFNGEEHGAFLGKGIGLLSFDGAYAPSTTTWLTNTTGTDERDPVLARIGTNLASDRFLVGWRLQAGNSFHLAVVNASGTVLDALETVSPNVGWGNRDDSMKPRADGSITWLQGTASSTTLKLHRYSETVTNCAITDLAAGTQTACDPGTNLYTQEIVVTYSDPPAGGMLNVNGQAFAIGSSPQTVTLSGLVSDGASVNVTASFTADPSCTRTENALFTAPAACQPGGQTCANPNLAIPDNDPAGITSDIVVNDNLTVTGVQVTVDIQHTWIGDLVVELLHGATTVRLHNLSGGDADNIVGTYPTTLVVDGPGALGDFVGQSGQGTWTLKVSDNAPQDTGTLVSWCIDIQGTPNGCAITDLAAGTQTPCNPNTSTYTQEVVVTYTSAPATGNLVVNGQSFAITTSPQAVVLAGLVANAAPVNVTASFSDDGTCSRTENALFTAPSGCAAGGTECVNPSIAIPDNNPVGITSDVVWPSNVTIAAVRVSVDITHTFRGDLHLEVTHNGTTVVLKVPDGSDNAADVVGTYPTSLPVSGPGSLADFNGGDASGPWTLRVADNFGQDVGTLNSWCVEIDATPTDIGPGLDLPVVLSLQPSWPNPARDGLTNIRFGLPTAQHVSLQVYDVMGRLVRTLFEGESPAGYHDVLWNGLDQRGRRVNSGIYFYRLKARSDALTGKLIVVR